MLRLTDHNAPAWVLFIFFFIMGPIAAMQWYKDEKELRQIRATLGSLVQIGTKADMELIYACMEEKGIPKKLRINSDWVLIFKPIWVKTFERNYKME